MHLINGRAIAKQIRLNLKQKIAESGKTPGLGVILVGNDPASHLYVSLKGRACKEVGIHFEKFLFPEDAEENNVIATIEQLNNRADIHGILVQLPLPKHLNTDKIIRAINPTKDVDGFHPENIRLLLKGSPRVEPVLAKAIWRVITATLQHLNTATHKQLSNETMKQFKTLIIGNSEAFTQPLEAYLRQKGLKAIHAHPRQSKQWNNGTMKQFDIIVVAVGKPNFLLGKNFKKDAIVIDVGINKLKDGSVVGDVDFASIKDKDGWITPVPGGVGPVTVAMLLENTFLLSKSK